MIDFAARGANALKQNNHLLLTELMFKGQRKEHEEQSLSVAHPAIPLAAY